MTSVSSIWQVSRLRYGGDERSPIFLVRSDAMADRGRDRARHACTVAVRGKKRVLMFGGERFEA
ncbi:hypothetical protein RSP799_10435 [Ralstonia solanacearum]|nr:hypothetical protein RSP799_10435 [Ralstonia solanacearum]